MEKNIINAENADNGFLDITGVKKDICGAAPERSEKECRHAADDGKDDGEISVKNNIAEGENSGQTKPGFPDEADAAEKNAFSSAEAPKRVSSACVGSEAEKEDKEFLDLIRGKYREAYRRRTENIIRRRLKNVKSKPQADAENASLTALPKAECTADGKSESAKTEGSAAEIIKNSDYSLKTKNIDAITKTTDFSYKKSAGAVTGDTDLSNIKNGVAGKANETAITEKADIGTREKNGIDIQRSVNRNRPRENGVGGSVGMVTGINVSALNGSEILELLRRAESGEKIKFK